MLWFMFFDVRVHVLMVHVRWFVHVHVIELIENFYKKQNKKRELFGRGADREELRRHKKMMLSGYRCVRSFVAGSSMSGMKGTLPSWSIVMTTTIASGATMRLYPVQQRREFSFLKQDQLHQLSLKDPEGFWGEASKLVSWDKPADK